jgi:methylenetetrahydrofolate reductase (NADPH)
MLDTTAEGVLKYVSEGQLERTLRQGRFAVTAEITPPLSSDPNALLDKGRPLRGLVDGVNVTDGASARTHMASLAAAAILARDGIEPVLQLNTRDYNRIALQSSLIGAAALGIHNVLCLTGDRPEAGDQPDAKAVFDLKSSELVACAATMRDEAKLPSGRAIEEPPRLFIGAADSPIDPPPNWRPEALLAKVAAGIDFVQTQFCFDAAVVRRYAARLIELGLTERLFVLIGIGPLASARSALWMREHLFGTIIPDALIDRLESAEDERAEGRRICVELIAELRDIPGVAGVHLMAPLNAAAVPLVIEESGVRRTSAPS